MGAFIEMCCEVLFPSEHDELMNDTTGLEKKHLLKFSLPKTKDLGLSMCNILVKEESILDNSSDAKCLILDQVDTDQPLLVTISGQLNAIGRCVGIVQNMVVDGTLMDGVDLSHKNLDVLLGH